MTLAQDFRRSYTEMIGKLGETVTLRRINKVGDPTEVQVRAHVAGYLPKDLVGGIKQGDRRVIILAEDVEISGFPVPFKTTGTDKIVVRGEPLNIGTVDDSTRRVSGVLIAYDIKATG